MNSFRSPEGQMGLYSTIGMFAIGLLYVATYVGWLASGANPSSPIGDPFLAVMEALTLLSAPLLVVMMAVIHRVAAEDKKVFSLTSFAFAIAAASITSAVHFVQLTAVRQLGGDITLRWPGIAYALDQLAWEAFIGLSLLFAALTFGGDRLTRLIRTTMLLSGSCCLAGTLGPLLGDMRIQRIGILGYAVTLPIVCLLLALSFRRSHSNGDIDAATTSGRAASQAHATNHGPVHYLFSCGLLLLPALIWNIAFFHRLPPAFATSEFWRDIPAPLAFIENSLRAIVFGLPFAMPLSTSTPARRWSLFIFGLGSLVYFSSWLALIVSPDSRWSTSALGFMAPAYTPALWLFGLATLGRRLFWGRFYRWWMYAVVSIGFLIAHIAHTALVYARTQ